MNGPQHLNFYIIYLLFDIIIEMMQVIYAETNDTQSHKTDERNEHSKPRLIQIPLIRSFTVFKLFLGTHWHSMLRQSLNSYPYRIQRKIFAFFCFELSRADFTCTKSQQE